MTLIRSAISATPRTRLLRTPTQIPRTLPLSQRSYASIAPRVADDVKPAAKAEEASEDLSDMNEDPNMNGNYPDPSLTSALPLKRQFRDPYTKWWDPQERRNFNEPVHEDNDILGIFSPEAYTHFTPGWGGVLVGTFVATFSAVCLVVYRLYPDRASARRTFDGGLEAELGGPGAPRARESESDDGAVLER